MHHSSGIDRAQYNILWFTFHFKPRHRSPKIIVWPDRPGFPLNHRLRAAVSTLQRSDFINTSSRCRADYRLSLAIRGNSNLYFATTGGRKRIKKKNRFLLTIAGQIGFLVHERVGSQSRTVPVPVARQQYHRRRVHRQQRYEPPTHLALPLLAGRTPGATSTILFPRRCSRPCTWKSTARIRISIRRARQIARSRTIAGRWRRSGV